MQNPCLITFTIINTTNYWMCQIFKVNLSMTETKVLIISKGVFHVLNPEELQSGVGLFGMVLGCDKILQACGVNCNFGNMTQCCNTKLSL